MSKRRVLYVIIPRTAISSSYFQPTSTSQTSKMAPLSSSSRLYHCYRDSEIHKLDNKVLLQEMLSNKCSVIVSDCSDSNEDTHRQIGKGQCGTIYTIRYVTDNGIDEEPSVLKLANHEGKVEELKNDHEQHILVRKTYDGLPEDFRRNIDISRLQSDFGYTTNAPSPRHAFTSSRILPVPRFILSTLVDLYAPKRIKKIKQEFLDRPE